MCFPYFCVPMKPNKQRDFLLHSTHHAHVLTVIILIKMRFYHKPNEGGRKSMKGGRRKKSMNCYFYSGHEDENFSLSYSTFFFFSSLLQFFSLLLVLLPFLHKSKEKFLRRWSYFHHQVCFLNG